MLLHFALVCTLLHLMHTHTLWHVECLMSWFYHVLIFYVFTCQFFINYSLNSVFRVLIQNFWFGTNLLLIKFVVLCVLSCFLILHDIAWQCLPSRNQLWKEVVAREKNRWLILIASSLSQRRLDHRQDFMMLKSLDHMPYLKLMWTTSRMPPCW